MMTAIKEKMIESLKSVLPIALIVLLVSVAFTPLSVSTVVLFVIVLIFTMLQLFIQRKWKNY